MPMVSVSHNLSGNTHIRFLLLMCMDNVPATETRDGLFQVFAENELEFGVLTVGLEESVLAQALVYIIRSRRKILHGHKLLVGTHEHLKEFDYIQPIDFFHLALLFSP